MTRLVALAVACLAGAAHADRAVTADGELLRGAMRVDGAELVITPAAGDEQRRALRDFHLVEADDGKLIWTPGLSRRMRGYEYLSRGMRLRLLVDLLKQALKIRAVELGRKLLDRAESEGFTGTESEKLKRQLEELEKKYPTPDPERLRALEARLPEVRAIHTHLLLQRVRAAEGAGALAILREVLRIDAHNAEARALLAARAPKDFPVGDSRLWLDWQLDLAPAGATLAPTDRSMVLARKHWRKDVYGVLAGPIRLVTPVRDTRTVARCIAYGQLTARALHEVFRTDAPRRRVAQRLTVFMYGSRREYEATSRAGGVVKNREFLRWSAGHYSPAERVSRVVWYGDRDAQRRIARVFVHELTHHWLQEMNPRYADSEVRRPAGPGYWIAEGFADFMEEGRYDVEGGTWSLFDSRSSSLDVVASLAGSGELLPWRAVYEMDYHKFLVLPRDRSVAVVRRWMVGRQKRSKSDLFYDQAAATCHFLYHADRGKWRNRLRAYVAAYYTRNRDRLRIGTTFGMAPRELGIRVEKFARAVAAGWRPEEG